MTKASKYSIEEGIVAQFLSVQGIANLTLINPNDPRSPEVGVDVRWLRDRRRIGFQVTEFSGDEDALRRGSELRRRESEFAKSNAPYVVNIPVDPTPGLAARIAAKVQKAERYNFSDFHEVNLLVASSAPTSLAATSIFPPAVNLEKLNAQTSGLLNKSKYVHAYVFNWIGVDGSYIFEWNRKRNWTKLIEPTIKNDGPTFWDIQPLLRATWKREHRRLGIGKTNDDE